MLSLNLRAVSDVLARPYRACGSQYECAFPGSAGSDWHDFKRKAHRVTQDPLAGTGFNVAPPVMMIVLVRIMIMLSTALLKSSLLRSMYDWDDRT